MTQSFFVGGKLPGLNDLLAAAKQLGEAKQGRRWSGYASAKKEWGQIIVAEIKAAKLRPMPGLVFLRFEWREANRRRDLDNVAAAKKIVGDALVTAGVIKGDGWHYIAGWQDTFVIDRAHPGVQVTLVEVVAGS